MSCDETVGKLCLLMDMLNKLEEECNDAWTEGITLSSTERFYLEQTEKTLKQTKSEIHNAVWHIRGQWQKTRKPT